MVDAVNIAGGASVAPVAPAVRAPALVATANASGGNASSKASIVPDRLFDDPQSGVLVTQQLDAEGQIIQQNPTSSVLAYLRNGLTIDGLPKQTTVA